MNSNTDAVYDIVRSDPAQAHVPLEGWIQQDVTVALFKQVGLDFEALKKLAQTRDFKPVPLPGATLTRLRPRQHTRPSSRGTCWVVCRARRRPDETLIYSAHWDHFGIRPPAPAAAIAF